MFFKEGLLGYARHLATKDFQDWFVKACIRTGSPPRHQWLFDSYDSKRDCLNMLATSPPMIFKNIFSNLVSLMARHLATKEFRIHIHQRESVWMCSPPRHQWFFMNDISKLVSGMARHLATREFWIHILQREPVWICSPPRHQGFSRLICQSLYQNWLATSPPMTFWFVWFKERLFEYGRHLATNDFSLMIFQS